MAIEGMSKREACEKLGINWSTFMYWQSEHPEVYREFSDRQTELLKINAVQLQTAHQEVLNKLVAQASVVTNLSDILALESRLRVLSAEAKLNSGEDSAQQKAAANFLTGIHQVPGISKITRTTETVEFGADENTIDGEVKELDK
jgi:hypothetical protein